MLVNFYKVLLSFTFVFASSQIFGQTCNGSVGDNIFPDGDFGAGTANILPIDPMLAPGYQYQRTPPPDDGFYTITNNTGPWGSFAADSWINIRDNSSDPNGYMMVVNATFTPGLFYEKTVSVCGNTNYEFSADVIAMNDPTKGSGFIPPNISFLINDEIIFSTGNVPIDTRWHSYGFTFTSEPGATEIKLALRNNAPGGFGNDLALDNISFRPCGPSVVVIDTVQLCRPQATSISAEIIGDAFANPVFQWQISADNGGSWTDIPNETEQVLQLPEPSNGQLFRLTVASSAANLAQSSCRIVSNVSRISIEPLRGTAAVTICQGASFSINGMEIFEETTLDIPSITASGCDSITTYNISIEDLADFAIDGLPFICAGASTTLDAGEFATYEWSTGASSSTLDVEIPGIYGVTVTSENGCTGSDTAQIQTSGITDFVAEVIPPLCANSEDGQINLSDIQGDTPPFLYALNDQPFQISPVFENLRGNDYKVSIQNVNGCQFSKMIRLSAPPTFAIELTEDARIELGDSILLNATSNFPIAIYQWQPPAIFNCANCPNPTVLPLRTTNIRLDAFNGNGCLASDSLTVFVFNSAKIFAPTAFSPNGDGVNDVFVLFPGKAVSEIIQLEIFDRWGNRLYANEIEPIWDGTFAGKMAALGVYAWSASVAFIDGSVQQLSGEVTLIR